MDLTNQAAREALAEVYFHRGELDPFVAEAERAIALNPNNARTLAELGQMLQFAGDERGITLVRKAMKLDPFHPTWFNFPIAYYHFDRGEYEEALAAARRINIPGAAAPQMYLAAIYAELGRQSEARSAMEELLRIWRGATADKYVEELRKWNYPEDSIRRWVAALRKAGLPD